MQLAGGDFAWARATGGVFASTNNWQSGIVPYLADTARWNLRSTGYTVSFDTDARAHRMIVQHDTLTFELGGHSFDLDGQGALPAIVLAEAASERANLTLRTGTLRADSAMLAQFTGSSAQLTIADGGVLDVTTLQFGDGDANLRIGGNGHTRVTDRVDLGRAAAVQLTSGGTMEVGTGRPAPGPDTPLVHADGLLEGAAVIDGHLHTLGTISLEVASAMNSDQLDVTGTAQLAGVLDLDYTAGFPSLGESFTLIRAQGGLTGTFDTVNGANFVQDNIATIVGYTSDDVRLVVTVPGDANLDGSVDGSDFGIWNANKFTCDGSRQQGDFNLDGCVDGSDFGI